MAIREIDNSTSRIPAVVETMGLWLRGLFLEDWWVKLLALLISVGLWWGVTGTKTSSTVRVAGVHLNYQYPPNMEISNDPRTEVEVTLAGSDRMLQRINARDLVAYVDLTGIQPGDRLVSLTRERIRMGLPEGVRIEDVEPNTVAVLLEPKIDGAVKVQPRLEGSVPDGFEVTAVTTRPSQIRVRGPEKHVQALTGAPTESISLNSRQQSFTVSQAAIDISDRKINVLDPVVSVVVTIGEKRVEKKFTAVAVTVPGGGKARPSTATVSVLGPRSVVEALQPGQIQIALDPGPDGKFTPRLVSPDNAGGQLTLQSTVPATFTVNK